MGHPHALTVNKTVKVGCIDCATAVCDECGPSVLVAAGCTNLVHRQAPCKGDSMTTFTGRRYWPMDPRAEDVCIGDIAHSLSMQCRYGGHAREFYSVAEHSVYVSYWVPPEHALVALLHDATEAYVSDVPRPLKPYLANYNEIEARNWDAIAVAFDMSLDIPQCVRDVDLRICKPEMARLFPTPKTPYAFPGPDIEQRIDCWDPHEAKKAFLERFNQLWQERMDRRYPAAKIGRK